MQERPLFKPPSFNNRVFRSHPDIIWHVQCSCVAVIVGLSRTVELSSLFLPEVGKSYYVITDQGPGSPYCLGLGNLIGSISCWCRSKNMAKSPSHLGYSGRSLEIRTRSIEQTLVPLVSQVSCREGYFSELFGVTVISPSWLGLT